MDRLLALDALLENMAEGFAMCEAIWDGQGKLADYRILELNTALQRMLGVGPEAIGTRLSDGAAGTPAWLNLCEGVLKTGTPASFETYSAALDKWHEIRITRVTPDRMAQLFFDITERKKAEARQASLLDELNHRVGNNLTLVSAVLEMKARETDNDVVRDQLQRAVSRVQSIAQVHKALYRGPHTDSVEFGDYLVELCTAARTALVNDERIEVQVECEPVSVPLDTAIPLGMVVNELVTNAVKYAYPAPASGLILVRSWRQDEGLALSVRDFGAGLPAGGGGGAGSGLGMKLIGSLVAQVGGELQPIDSETGAAFEIRVPSLAGAAG
jgi:two-component sensor histidine kinase